MSDPITASANDESSALAALGSAMPEANKAPFLTQVQPLHSPAQTEKLSLIEAGLTFTGNITLQGPCTIAGVLLGHVHELPESRSQIVITETGVVTGDVFSHKVSVMGQYSGTLDASGGSVDLHAKSVVTGHIRYAQLQVNGADLNATLERVTAKTAPKVDGIADHTV